MEFGIVSLGDHRPDPVTGETSSRVQHHREIVELAVKADALGFDSFHLGEHHGCDYISSSPPVVLGAIASRTEHIRLSTGTTLLPTLDPVRVAEDYATLDLLSEGRAEIVAGRGIVPRTYLDFGHQPSESHDLFREKLELLLRLWTEREVHWEGRFRTALSGFTAEPRPVQEPHPPVWVGGGFSEESVTLAAELGLPLMLPSVLQPISAFAELVERYRERFVARGHGEAKVGGISHIHVAKDLDTVRERWEPRHRAYMTWVAEELMPWGFEPVLPEGAAAPQVPAFDFEHSIEGGPAVAGSPQQVVDKLAHFKTSVGLDVQLLHLDGGGMPQPLLFEAVELLASEVVPKLAD
jgi:alkanesulfonate monooxygenase SsuD/methylene tetrahydromethanopterin reductase-like flavin-dependent oxidoreductase (luciferase family)